MRSISAWLGCTWWRSRSSGCASAAIVLPPALRPGTARCAATSWPTARCRGGRLRSPSSPPRHPRSPSSARPAWPSPATSGFCRSSSDTCSGASWWPCSSCQNTSRERCSPPISSSTAASATRCTRSPRASFCSPARRPRACASSPSPSSWASPSARETCSPSPSSPRSRCFIPSKAEWPPSSGPTWCRW